MKVQSLLKLLNRLGLLSKASYFFFWDSSFCFCSLFLYRNLNTPSLLSSSKFDSFRHCHMFQNSFHAFISKFKNQLVTYGIFTILLKFTCAVHSRGYSDHESFDSSLFSQQTIPGRRELKRILVQEKKKYPL